MKLETRCTRVEWERAIEIRMAWVGVNRFDAAQPMVFVEHELGASIAPAITMHLDSAQQLMDELWQCGLRPSEGSGSAGALAATQRHLDDMRALVFKTEPTGV